VFEDSEVSMQGLVLDCANCHRLMMYPIHKEEFLKDWNKHGRLCLKCILRLEFPTAGLEGYIIEAMKSAEYFNKF